jgi:hypothetical protein
VTPYARSAAALLFALIGCAGDPPTGLGPSATGAGPMVIWDPERRPEPEVPFPNDSATVLDPASLTGRRLNLSASSPLQVERHLRERLNRLDGFSLFGMITVSFDAPLDLSTSAPTPRSSGSARPSISVVARTRRLFDRVRSSPSIPTSSCPTSSSRSTTPLATRASNTGRSRPTRS